VVLVEAVDEGAQRDPEQLGCSGLVSGALLERVDDPLFLVGARREDGLLAAGCPWSAAAGSNAFSRVTPVIAPGRSVGTMTSPIDSTAARSITLRNSRTFPGQGERSRYRSASGEMRRVRSLSSSDGAIAAQLSSTNGPLALGTARGSSVPAPPCPLPSRRE
jgi:hypothetical protein